MIKSGFIFLLIAFLASPVFAQESTPSATDLSSMNMNPKNFYKLNKKELSQIQIVPHQAPEKEEGAYTKRDANSLVNKILLESGDGESASLKELKIKLYHPNNVGFIRTKAVNNTIDELTTSPHILTHPKGVEKIISALHKSSLFGGQIELESLMSYIIDRLITNAEGNEFNSLANKVEYFHSQLEEIQKQEVQNSISSDCYVVTSLLDRAKDKSRPLSDSAIKAYKEITKRTFSAGKQLTNKCQVIEGSGTLKDPDYLTQKPIQDLIEDINNMVSPQGEINFDPLVVEKTNKIIETSVRRIDGLEGLFTVSIERDIKCKDKDFGKALKDNIDKLKFSDQIYNQCNTDTTAASSTGDACKTIIKIKRLSNDEINSHRQYQDNLQSLAALYKSLVTEELARKSKLSSTSQE